MKRKAIMERCDNPNCPSEYEAGGDVTSDAPGFHFGKGYWVLAGGGPIPAFYACRDACVVPAMHSVIDKAL